jgi:hypothetical protein
MQKLAATFDNSGEMVWKSTPQTPGRELGVRISFSWPSQGRHYQRHMIFRRLEEDLRRYSIEWLERGARGTNDWVIDLDALRGSFPHLDDLEWLEGSVHIEPEFEPIEMTLSKLPISYANVVAFYVTPEIVSKVHMPDHIPVEIQDSLRRFQSEHPDPSKVAFVMMKFGQTPAHDKITDSIRKVLAESGITALRADDKEYHPDVFPNVLTYIYGCRFGIAVFERLEDDDFNPNVALEVGYLLALRKPVCLLKEKTLKALNTDLGGKIYQMFDQQNPDSTIPDVLCRWAQDNGLI